MESLVTVIIPVYNVEDYLKNCIESALSQTYKNLEVFLIDDGSTDNCPKICDEFASKDSRVIAIHKKNEGQVLQEMWHLISAKANTLLLLTVMI